MARETVDHYRELLNTHQDDPDVRFALAHAYRITSDVGRSMGQYGSSYHLYYKAIDLLRLLMALDPESDHYRIELALTHQDLGEYLRMAGQTRAAEDELLKALETLKSRGKVDPEDISYARTEATTRINLAVTRLESGQSLEALPQATRAVDSLAALVEKPVANWLDRLYLAYALGAKASSLEDTGDRDGAWKCFEKARHLAEELIKRQNNTDTQYGLAMIFNGEGMFLYKARDYAKAIEHFDAANSILTSIQSKNQHFFFLEREMAISWNGRGASRLACHRIEGDPNLLELARFDCEHARAKFEKVAEEWPGNFDLKLRLGKTFADLGRIALASREDEAAHKWFGQAIRYLELVMKISPQNPENEQLLARIRDESNAVKPSRAPTSLGP